MARRKSDSKSDEVVDLGTFDPMVAAVVEMNVGSDVTSEVLGIHNARGGALPAYATDSAAGFDLSAAVPFGSEVTLFTSTNVAVTRAAKRDGSLVLHPGERALIPTGLYADIPEGYYMTINSRSGTSWKKGLMITNGHGIIDSDYVDELKISVINVSGVNVVIEDGERIAQGMLHYLERLPIKSITRPMPKGNRTGGFGSTGSK